ncbi:hypothetical protein [Micromonospora sp. 4G55]|uniref:AMP-binding enzyme n=1 Tax=Micromonospora sp. 4G55 TaxID=2806102 RepID=UPI001EE4D73C|nr:hypothetical protein [Micromonospora sp. 4G55]
MVKIRGNRIELGEVERRLLDHPTVGAAVAVAAPAADGEPSLHAFVVPRQGATVGAAELVQRCRRTMPAYMVPARFHFLTELPLTANGKANRTALAELARAAR